MLAQQQRSGDALDTTLLANDQQRSVLRVASKADQQPKSISYSPYGHRCAENGLLSLLGFNGERPDPVSGHYLLGNGYRAFNPVLMRFNSPDSLSPFGNGGLNSYLYCLGDPVNLHDPNGKYSLSRFLPSRLDGLQRPMGRNGRTYMNGPEQVFNTVTTQRPSRSFSYSNPNYSGRRHSSASQNPLPPSTEELTSWDEIGFHGSTEANAKSLMAGLDPSYAGAENGLTYGEGFYITPD
ncbi:MAG: RHS repeat-associated core domain-containing protein, partial [Hafnia sp.]